MVPLLLLAKYFCFFQGIQTGSDAHLGFYALGTGASLLGGKAAIEAGHLCQLVEKLGMNGTLLPASHVYHSMHRDNFYLYCTRGRCKECG